MNVKILRNSNVSQECANDKATERSHASAETESVSFGASSDLSDVVAKPDVEIPLGIRSAAGSNGDAATERVDCVLPAAEVLDIEQWPTEV